jgi:hypothetical protein
MLIPSNSGRPQAQTILNSCKSPNSHLPEILRYVSGQWLFALPFENLVLPFLPCLLFQHRHFILYRTAPCTIIASHYIASSSNSRVAPNDPERSPHSKMFPPSTAILATTTLLLLWRTTLIQAVDVTENPDLIAKLITANSQLDRLALLPDDATHWHFDFATQQNYNFAPGGVTNMNAATFPAAKGNRMTRECPFLPPKSTPSRAK